MILDELPVRQQVRRKVFIVDPVQADGFHDPVLQPFSCRVFQGDVGGSPWPEHKPGFLFHLCLLSAAIA